MSRELFDTVPARVVGRRSPERPRGPFTLAELEDARDYVAALIIRHGAMGEEILPIFDRLDRECESLREQKSKLDRVRAIAGRAA